MLFKIAYESEIHVITSRDLITFSKFDEFIKSVFKRLPSKYTLVYKDSDDDIICLANDADMKALIESGIKKIRIEIQPINNEDFYDQTQEILIDLPVEKIEETVSETIEEVAKETEQTEESVEQVPEKEEKELENKSIFSDEKSIDESINEALNKILPGLISQIKEEVSMSKIKFSHVQEEKEIPKIIPETKVVHIGITCDGCQASPITGIRYKCAVCPDFDFCEKCENSCNHDHPFLKIREIKHTPLKIFTVIEDEEDSLEFNGERCPIPNIGHGFNLFGGRSRQHCQRGFGGFREGCKRFAKECERTSEEHTNNFQKQTEKKEEKVEIPEPKVESKIEEPKIFEEKPKFNPSNQELAFTEAAAYISDIMNEEYSKIFRFVVNYPGLTKEEILMKFIEQ